MVTAKAEEAARLRLFVALALPLAARESLASWASQVLGGDESLRLVDTTALHVTLAFLGWRSVGDVEAVSDAVRAASGGQRAPELRAVGLAALPKRRPRVLAVDLEDVDGRAAAIQRAIAAALVEADLYEAERRAYRPHVTIARVRRRGRAPSGQLPDPPPLTALPSEVVVYRSDLSAAGARYTALTTVALL